MPGVDSLQVVEVLGLKRVRVQRGQIHACCPLHSDRHPSFSMNVETGQWSCFAGCGSGNLVTLLRRLDRIDLIGAAKGQRPEYVRVTDRTSGSIAVLLEQMRYAQFLQGMTTYGKRDFTDTRIVQALQDQFEVSRSTAYEIVGWISGRRGTWEDERGTIKGRRYAFCLKYLRENSKEHKLAIKTEKRYWSERTATLRLYAVCMQEVKYGQMGRESRITTAREMYEETMALDLIPNPPPEIVRWTRNEVEFLTREVMERQRRGVSLLAPWEIEPVPVVDKDEDDSWIEFTAFAAPTDALLLAA